MDRTDIVFIIYGHVSESFTLGVCYGMMENPESECEVPECEKHGVFGLVQFSAFFKNS